MQMTIIRDDNKVYVDGESHAVDCGTLPVDFHALQWVGNHGEVEYRMMHCEHCGGRNKKPNMSISDLSPYKSYLDAWHVAKAAADEARAAALAAAEKARADVTGSQA